MSSIYPINNFLPRQHGFGAGGNFQGHGSSRYQYGTATRGLSTVRFPAAAAFPAVAPFYWMRLIDNQGRSQTYEFRPDIAAPSTVSPVQAPSVAGRKVVAIQGLAAALVADQFVLAVTQTSIVAAQSFAPPLNAGSHLGIVAWQNTAQAVDDEVLLMQFVPGPGGLIVFTGPPAAPAGLFAISRFFGGSGSLFSGAAKASGFINCVAGALLVDTETFTIAGLAAGATVNPGNIVFEFDSGGGVTAGRVAVPFTGGDAASVVAASVVAAINNPGAPPAGPNTSPGFWQVIASLADPVGLPGVVLLRYRFGGSRAGSVLSPVFITDTVANAGFAVGGMAGGQDMSLFAPLRWGLSRGAVPFAPIDLPGGEG